MLLVGYYTVLIFMIVYNIMHRAIINLSKMGQRVKLIRTIAIATMALSLLSPVYVRAEACSMGAVCPVSVEYLSIIFMLAWLILGRIMLLRPIRAAGSAEFDRWYRLNRVLKSRAATEQATSRSCWTTKAAVGVFI